MSENITHATKAHTCPESFTLECHDYCELVSNLLDSRVDMIIFPQQPLIAKRLRGFLAVAAAGAVCLIGAPAQALTMPTNPFTTVGGALPVVFCKNPVTGGLGGTTNFATLDLKNVGCISGSASGYAGGGDGYYSNTGGGDRETSVEQQITLATGAVVDLTLRKEFGTSSSDDTGCTNTACTTFNSVGKSGIQIWMASDLKSFTWAAAPWLVSAMQANTIKLSYLTIKAANSYVIYQIPTGIFAGRYSTEGLLNGGSMNPAISHIRFWDGTAIAAPEPAAIGILGIGILALGLRRRRKR